MRNLTCFHRLQAKQPKEKVVEQIKLPEKIVEPIPRSSHSDFPKGYEIPAPPPTAIHPALRPAAARNLSSGSLQPLRSARDQRSIHPKASLNSLNSLNSRIHASLSPTLPSPLGPVRAVTRSNKPQHTPALPASWSAAHDRAICVLDARNYSLQQSVRKVKRTFPELSGHILTEQMLDKRLRILDEDPLVDYWKVGLDFTNGRKAIEPGLARVASKAQTRKQGNEQMTETNKHIRQPTAESSKQIRDDKPVQHKPTILKKNISDDGSNKENHPPGTNATGKNDHKAKGSATTSEDTINGGVNEGSSIYKSTCIRQSFDHLDRTFALGRPTRPALQVTTVDGQTKSLSTTRINTRPFEGGFLSSMRSTSRHASSA